MAHRSGAARKLSGSTQGSSLSDEFLRRIFSIVAMPEDWNGGSEARIEPATAAAAVRLASASTRVAPEPAVGPSPDGSVLLEWNPAPAVAMEAYVPPPGVEGYEVVVSRSGEVVDTRLATLDDVLARLAEVVGQA
jgi:hypothetical protein